MPSIDFRALFVAGLVVGALALGAVLTVAHFVGPHISISVH